jgi:DNA polymerase III epsilon subunit family exonuclease
MDKIILNENTLFLDTETTGLDSNAEICEITIIDHNGLPLINTLIKPIKPIPEEAIKIHGITNEMVKDAPSFSDIYFELLNILFLKKIIIYNADYDLRLLRQCADLTGVHHKSREPFEAVQGNSICAMKSYQQFTESNKWTKLTKACEQMKIDVSDITAHRALSDCIMTLRLIKAINSKLDLMVAGTEVKYIGNDQKYYGKMGIFERMISNSSAAKIKIDNIMAIFDISNLIAIDEKEPNNMTTQPEIITNNQLTSEIKFDIVFKQPEINFDEEQFKASINDVIAPVKDLGDNPTKEVLTETLAKLRKFQKEISDRRIAIVKEIKQPITDLESKIKKGDAEIETYISKYDALLKVIEAKTKAVKKTEIDLMITKYIESNKLNKIYAEKLTFLDEYYLVKWSFEKIAIDLDKRAAELFKQQDYERIQLELKNTQIESRARLIEQLNAEYNLEFKYAALPIDNYDDLAVKQHYIKTRSTLDEAQKQKLAEKPITSQFEQAAKVTAELDAIAEVWTHSKNEEVFPKTESDSPYLIYQNLRLGAANQSLIMQAVAKLKADGLNVEFIK